MSKRKQKDRKAGPVVPPANKRSAAGKTGMLLAIVIPVCAGVWWLMPAHVEVKSPIVPLVASEVATLTGRQSPAEFQKLKGKWLRPDGGYVVEVRGVEDGGRMDASYFNPRSIHVAKAEASWDGAATKVFIELRDKNYPGSTYSLTYDPRGDRLAGIYYQAALQQSFEVFFVRME